MEAQEKLPAETWSEIIDGFSLEGMESSPIAWCKRLRRIQRMDTDTLQRLDEFKATSIRIFDILEKIKQMRLRLQSGAIF